MCGTLITADVPAKRPRVVSYLKPEELGRLEKAAERRGYTVSSLIRVLLLKWLAEQEENHGHSDRP